MGGLELQRDIFRLPGKYIPLDSNIGELRKIQITAALAFKKDWCVNIVLLKVAVVDCALALRFNKRCEPVMKTQT